jgi:flavin reductase (DIM6/NTAB) family NADH-FMN oxidoreductase RutF
VGEAKAHLECELVQVVSDRNTHIVLGRIVHAHVEPSVWKDGRVDPRLLDPICRLSGSGYAALGQLFSVQRPKWKEVAGTQGQEAMPRAAKR